MYYRECGGIKSNHMLLLTPSDAKFCAEELNKLYPEFIFEAGPNFLGYEGADWGVSKYERRKVFWDKNGVKGRFLDSVHFQILQEMCKDRPIVPQSESFKS